MTATNTLTEPNLIDELPPLRRYARVLTGNSEQADSLVVETLSCARRKQSRWKQRTSLRTWLFTIMRRLHRDQSRHLWRQLTQTVRNGHGRPAGRSETPASAIRSDAGPDPILVHLSRLPPEQCEVLVLVAVERLAYAEIATVLRVPVGTVLRRLTRAREALRLMTIESLPR
jgi:RNA polymerase sigma-70 factor (ECF subfamily)